MVLYVTRVPDPAPGTDWTTVVPGQWLYNIVSVSALLTSGAAQTTLHDSSGNGNNGTYEAVVGHTLDEALGKPGAIAGVDKAVKFATIAAGIIADCVRVPATTMVWSGNITFEWWAKQSGAAPSGNIFVPQVTADLFTPSWITAPARLQFTRALQTYRSVAGVPVYDNAYHHYAIVFPLAGAVVYYRDGVAFGSSATIAPGLRNASAATDGGFNFPQGPGAQDLTMDELAIYPSALSAARISAHFAAASVSFAAYTAAVLADAPAMYYHLDEARGGGRQVTLAITDGTHLVDEFCTGFAEQVDTSAIQYTWQVGVPNNTQTPAGDATTVGVPRLALPAGYTIGARTLDIGPDDQWSDVAVWWNTDVMDAELAVEPYAYPPGALLALQSQIEGK